MTSRGATIRLAAGVVFAFALAAAITPFAGGRAAAQDNGLASITIYTTICPVGYTGNDYFADCYDNLGADIQFLLTGPTFPGGTTATTGANGFTAFEGIDQDGVYTLQIQVPGDFTDFVADCSAGGENFPFSYGDLYGEIDLDLTTSDDLRCDFYVIPIDQVGEQSSITIYKPTCPAGYDGGDYFDDCYNNPTSGVRFLLNVGGEGAIDATTNAAGFAAFEGLGSGTFILVENTVVEEFVVFCSANGEAFPFEYLEGNAIQLEVTADDDIRCDWYNIPAGDGKTPTAAPTQVPATSTVSTLPNTGVGDRAAASGVLLPLATAVILLGIGGAGLFASRSRFSRITERTDR